MTAQDNTPDRELQSSGRINRLMYKFTGLMGLTTGIGVIAWGAWSIVTAAGTFVYEETGVSVEEILINNGLNEGLLQSSIVIALGVIILELRKIQHALQERSGRLSGDGTAGPAKDRT